MCVKKPPAEPGGPEKTRRFAGRVLTYNRVEQNIIINIIVESCTIAGARQEKLPDYCRLFMIQSYSCAVETIVPSGVFSTY